MMSHLCNRRVREFLILAHTWFAFGLPSKTGCDTFSHAVDPLDANDWLKVIGKKLDIT
jgi:hypothetical protein